MIKKKTFLKVLNLSDIVLRMFALFKSKKYLVNHNRPINMNILHSEMYLYVKIAKWWKGMFYTRQYLLFLFILFFIFLDFFLFFWYSICWQKLVLGWYLLMVITHIHFIQDSKRNHRLLTKSFMFLHFFLSMEIEGEKVSACRGCSSKIFKMSKSYPNKT